MVDADTDDEVEVEYPLYACSIDKLFKEQQKLTLLEFPLRPQWRPYDTEHAQSVRYKPNHRMLEMKATEVGAEDGHITLSGKGAPHDSTLCALVHVDNVFTLLSVDEIIQMRPDMSRTDVATAKGDKANEDPDYKPPVEELKKAAGKSAMRAVQVEVTKRETERQMETRMRSHAYLREQHEAEPWVALKMHDRAQGSNLLVQSCRRVFTNNAASTDMSMKPDDYIKLISPCTWIDQTDAGANGGATEAEGAAVVSAMPALDDETLQAVKEALTSLFEQHAVVSLSDVRSWLGTYQPKPAARLAANIPDRKLHELLVGGGSIKGVRGKYVLTSSNNPATNAFRTLVLELLEQSDGLRKADVMNAAKSQGLEVSEHLYNKVLKELCVAQGAVWSLRQGAF